MQHHAPLALPSYPDNRQGRAIGLAVVVAAHGLLLWAVLTFRETLPARLLILPATLLREAVKPPPPPPKIKPKELVMQPPKLDLPDIKLDNTPPKTRPDAIPNPSRPRFGPADGQSLAITLDAAGTGGRATRAQLGDYDGDARKKIASARVIPKIPKDVRHSCMIEYTVTIDRSGRRVSYSIEPCTIEEINQAARRTIERVQSFPVPPNMVGSTHVIHGTINYNLKVEE